MGIVSREAEFLFIRALEENDPSEEIFCCKLFELDGRLGEIHLGLQIRGDVGVGQALRAHAHKERIGEEICAQTIS